MPPKPVARRGPKNAGRRSKEERDQLEKAEAEKRIQREQQAQADARVAEATHRRYLGIENAGRGRGNALQRGAPPRRGRGIGGRGGFMDAQIPRFAPTPHGRGGTSSLASQRASGGGSGGAGTGSSKLIKREPQIKDDPDDLFVSDTKLDKEIYLVEDSDDEMSRQRIDVHGAEILEVPSDDDDQDPIALANGIYADKSRRPTYPIRVKRTEHKTRSVGINADASATIAQDVKRQADSAGEGIKKTKRRSSEQSDGSEKPSFRGVYADDDGSSAAKGGPTQSTSDGSGADGTGHAGPRRSTSPRARRKSGGRRHRSPIPQTEEEREERRIEHAETELIRLELSSSFPDRAPGERSDNDEDQQDTIRSNANYLFQLPPNLPELLNPNEKVKDERRTPEPTEDKSADSGKPAADVETIVKPDPDADGKQNERATHPKSGLVGKLRVHKSGKVSLSWGGDHMEVRHGTDAYFLQSIVLTESQQAGLGTGARQQSRALCFGQVRGKMVVTPNWDHFL